MRLSAPTPDARYRRRRRGRGRFRDILRDDRGLAADYEAIKRRAADATDDWTEYTGLKKAFVQRVLAEESQGELNGPRTIGDTRPGGHAGTFRP